MLEEASRNPPGLIGRKLMNRRFGVFAIGAMVLLGAAGTADAQMKGYAGVGGGVAIPLGDFKDAVKLGWVAQAMAGISTQSIIGARVNVNYGQHSFKGEVDGKAKILTVTGDVVLSPKMSGKMSAYVLAGAGIGNEKVEGSSETKFLWNAGAGIRAGMIYLEARFVSVKHDGGSTNWVPITVGVRFPK